MRYIDSWQLGCYVINYIIDKINPTPVSNPRSTGQTDFISPNRPRLVSQAEDAPPPTHSSCLCTNSAAVVGNPPARSSAAPHIAMQGRRVRCRPHRTAWQERRAPMRRLPTPRLSPQARLADSDGTLDRESLAPSSAAAPCCRFSLPIALHACPSTFGSLLSKSWEGYIRQLNRRGDSKCPSKSPCKTRPTLTNSHICDVSSQRNRVDRAAAGGKLLRSLEIVRGVGQGPRGYSIPKSSLCGTPRSCSETRCDDVGPCLGSRG